MVEPSENDNQNNAGLPSFWELREYVRTVKRVDQANKLCTELDLMIRERARIEKAYSNNLETWECRWMEFWNSKVEYGSGSLPWLGLCSEAHALSDAHMKVYMELTEDIHTLLKNWQKDHFHKAKIPPNSLKESKQLDKEFERAQKPWTKKIKKVFHCKHDYHDACRMERSLQVQVQNAKNDPSGTQEQLKKVEEKWKKAEKDLEQTRSQYQSSIRELEIETPHYLDEMTRVFKQSQEAERERKCFFRDIALKVRGALNITEKTEMQEIYAKVDEAIAAVDVEADLDWWSTHHGIDMSAVFPVFEEYSPEITAITNKKRTTTLDTNNTVTLTGITPIVSLPVQPEIENEESATPPNGVKSGPITNPFDEEEEKVSPTDKRQPHGHAEARDRPVATKVAGAAAADEQAKCRATGDGSAAAAGTDASETDYCSSATYDDGRPGVKVRALYDYSGQEDDELSFKAASTPQATKGVVVSAPEAKHIQGVSEERHL